MRPPDPYVDQTPTNVLSRQRLLGTFDGEGAIGAPVFTVFAPMSNLLTDPTNASYLVPFGGLAGDIRIRIQATGNTGTYGLTQVSWGYGRLGFQNSFAGETDEQFLNRVSTANTYLLDASSSESLEFTIPFVYPRSYFPIHLVEDRYATLIIANRGTYSAVGGSPAPTYEVFANFENVTTHILTPDTIVNENMEVGRVIQDQRTWTVGAALLGGKMVLDEFTRTMRTATEAGNMARETLGAMGEAAGQAGETLSAAGGTIYETVSAAGNYFTSTDETQGGHNPVKQSFFGDISTTAYTKQNNVLDITHPTKLVTMIPGEDLSLETIANIPAMIGQFEFSSSSPVGLQRTVAISLCPAPSLLLATDVTPGCYLGENFRFVAYDTRVIFHFRLTPLTSARIRIVCNYTSFTNPAASYDIPSDIILVKGSMDYPYYVPYCNINPLVEPSTIIARLSVVLLTPPKKLATTDVTMPVWVSKSFANTTFASPQSFVQEDSELRDMHKNVFAEQYQRPFSRVTHLTEVKDLYTLLRRYDEEVELITDPIIPYPETKEAFNALSNYQKLSLPFAFYTGSKEVKLRTTEATDFLNPEGYDIGLRLQNSNINQNRISDGQTLSDSRLWPMVECVVPYISNVPFQSLHSDMQTKVFPAIPVGFNATRSTNFSRAGPDFGLAFFNVLPSPVIWQATPTP